MSKEIKLGKSKGNNASLDGLELASVIAKCISEKKGTDVVAIDLQKLTTIADYFVIASASNIVQAKAIAENVDEFLSKEYGIEPLGREGLKEGRWVALDYSTVIVHIFLADTRQMYQLEKLWTTEHNVMVLDKNDKLVASN